MQFDVVELHVERVKEASGEHCLFHYDKRVDELAILPEGRLKVWRQSVLPKDRHCVEFQIRSD